MGGNVLREKDPLGIALMAAAFCATFFFKVNVIYSILAAAVIGAGKAVVLARRAKGAGK